MNELTSDEETTIFRAETTIELAVTNEIIRDSMGEINGEFIGELNGELNGEQTDFRRRDHDIQN